MGTIDWTFALFGLGGLLAAVLPRAVARRPLSMPLVFLVCGLLLYLSPLPLPEIDPVEQHVWVEHATEIVVIIALMGAGLALNRPVGPRRWAVTWRLLAVTMPLTIAATALAGWLLAGWPPAVALLLAAVLAPTDPVLAAEVRVGEPTDSEHDEDEVRFALTSEAGLNDGLAFPVVNAALALAAAAGAGWSADWIGHWALVDVGYKCVVGVLCGLAVGRLLGWMFFRAGWAVLRLAEHKEGFVALGATFLSYGVTELLHGYGFLAVFVTACTVRAAERAHGYHLVLHEFTEQVERLGTVFLLFVLGGFIALGGLAALTWRGAAVALLLLLVIRPLSGWLGQLGGSGGPRERLVTAFFGIRGVGSLFYLSYALGQDHFPAPARELWAVVAFTVLCSVVLHGVSATPLISRVDRLRAHRLRRAEEAGPESGPPVPP
ncbi:MULTISPECIES: sodium:proton antiporter [Streptomyces]|uniref:Sodium:proton antiporter n=1 Tax=Streptomyces lycii TaxID=2654337 RepID=A0ABQ7FDT4_9ACTN|nr:MULTISPECIES: cation:proton antiporter [Streptomyces]KAF4407206.1 sodium:proton antiporter [Streptomyces lycii]PGH46887.1 cation transporter [Streptomyces sp. Ru87]